MPAVKILMDECLAGPVVNDLVGMLSVYEDRPEIESIVSLRLAGVMDEVWVPQKAAEGWVVISSDRGRSNRGKRLPMLCRTHAVTLIMMTATVHNMRQADKARAIASVWPGIVEACAAPAGTMYVLQREGARGFRLRRT